MVSLSNALSLIKTNSLKIICPRHENRVRKLLLPRDEIVCVSHRRDQSQSLSLSSYSKNGVVFY